MNFLITGCHGTHLSSTLPTSPCVKCSIRKSSRCRKGRCFLYVFVLFEAKFNIFSKFLLFVKLSFFVKRKLLKLLGSRTFFWIFSDIDGDMDYSVFRSFQTTLIASKIRVERKPWRKKSNQNLR